MGKKTKLGKFRKDKFYKLAKETGFRSRAAFKLIQLNRKFGFLQQSQVCIDLCAAPGGWMQVAKQNMPVSSIVVGVDLFPIRPIPGCISLIEDITTEKCKAALTKELQSWKADVILHDGAPNVGKNWLFDAYQQICLTLSALKLSTNFLRSGGWFVTKVFRSKDYNALLWVLKQLFKRVHATKPSASRKESAEIFIVCQNYFAPAKIDPKFFDPKYVFEEIDLKAKNTTLLHPEKQKRVKAEGYTESDFSMRQELSVEDFMKNDHGLSALQGVSSIKIDNEDVRNHPKTTTEILECCKDIKVLGRKDLKNLLNWWKHVREDLFKKVEETKIEEEPAEEKPLTQEEVEEMEFEELEAKIAELTEEEKREAKRKRKKQLKERAKLNEKMNLKMVIKGDTGPTENEEEDIFNLKQISTMEELEKMQDVAPDMLAEEEEGEKPLIPKYKRYDKDDKNLDDDGNYEDGNDSEGDEMTESGSDYDKDGLGLSDTEDNEKRKKVKKKKAQEHPLIKPCDYRDKDTKRQQRVQLWFEKDTLQNIDTEKDENYDLDRLAAEYSKKGVKVLGSGTQNGTAKKVKAPPAPVKKSDNYAYSTASESETTDSDSDDESVAKGPKVKKIRLNEQELALGSIMARGKKAKRDLIDSNWNRYTFNDENLPDWFVKEEQEHMTKPLPVPKEFAEEYEKKVRELNVRPIKKVMEAKARKKKRALKRMEKAKKKAEQVLENQDATAQEKMRQLRNLYKKASQEKKKEVTYVVTKKHQAAKRIRRPAGVKGRFRVVDPRMKKDKRAVKANKKKGKKRG